MKKSLTLFAIIIAMMSIFFTSCEKATEYQKPTISELELQPNPCHPGDTIKAVLVYSVPGDCWYWWSQSFSTPTKQFNENRGTCNDPSYVYFLAPEKSGDYTISFKGQITITSGKELWGDAYELTRKLIVY